VDIVCVSIRTYLQQSAFPHRPTRIVSFSFGEIGSFPRFASVGDIRASGKRRLWLSEAKHLGFFIRGETIGFANARPA
jgi:hypothetical protein